MSIRKAQDERIEGTPDGLTAVTEITDVPDTPTIGAATDLVSGSGVSVAFTPAATGGTATTYTATSTPSSITGSAASSPITVTGLTLGTAYTFTVSGSNATGTSPESAASSPVTPTTYATGYMDALATVTVGSGGTSVITFAAIPSTYTHLQIRGVAQQTNNAGANCTIRFNSDSSSNYNSHYLGANGSTTGAGYFTNGSTTGGYAFDSANNGNSAFSGFIIDILDYTSTDKYTTTKSLSGWSNNSDSENLSMMTSAWRNTDAVTTITLQDYSGGSFAQYSSFTLYGIKG